MSRQHGGWKVLSLVSVGCGLLIASDCARGRDRAASRGGANWGAPQQNASVYRDQRSAYSRSAPQPVAPNGSGRNPGWSPNYGYAPQPAPGYRPNVNGYVNTQPYSSPSQWRPPVYQTPAVNRWPSNTSSQTTLTSRVVAPVVTVPSPTHSTPRPTPASQRPLSVRESAAALLLAQTRETVWNVYDHYVASPGYSDTYRDFYQFLQSVQKISERTTGEVANGTPSEAVQTSLRDAEVALEVLTIQTETWQRDKSEGEAAEVQTQLAAMRQSLTQLMSASGVSQQDFAAAVDEPATPIRSRQ